MAHYNRAKVLKMLGKNVEALAAYDKALDYDSNYSAAYTGKAIVLGIMGKT
eukprot:CAMPEP_0114598622 /NCGR_PEP_ID=MMETSP0125-20121206/21025_1 /TAXON_ID=485358 ORGANISM="Aristerostoma sp., Strain ATCC 50986" /NCGR_SAMPLE_ID=MMETSP0125 /ASSEMBLY_ACC=CAM_ASM_000245 /LENGTH=50 /DNA_ID=CAMNT_0001804603 /DNA_START=20 /DNA_END=172 /DNA_ORIENTATION=+